MNDETLLIHAENIRNRHWMHFYSIFAELGNNIGRLPEIKLNNRLRTTGARCFYDKRIIDLNTAMFRENYVTYETEIIPHELAHQIAWDIFGDKGHGKPWKWVMVKIGLEPNRCHNMNTPIRKR